MNTSTRTPASPLFPLVALLGLLSAACGTTPPLPVDSPPVSEPTIDEAEAKAAFSEAYAAYAAANEDGELSPEECAEVSAGFDAVYRDSGEQLVVARFNSAVIHERCGDLEQALTIYRGLAEQGFHLALNNLGVLEWQEGNAAAALGLFERSVEADSVAAFAARNNLAAAHRDRYADKLAREDFATAEQQLQNVLAVDTSNKGAYENLARLYYDRGRLEDRSYLVLANLVVTQALRVLEQSNEQSADIWNLRGLLLMEEANQVDALKAFKQAVKIETKHADANRNIGFIAIRFRDYEGAVQSFEYALEDPAVQRDAEVYIAMGVAKRGLEDYEGAEHWYREAMTIDEGDPRPWYNLAILNQDHLIGQDGVDQARIEAYYNVAKGHCATFETMAKGDRRYSGAVEDCADRVAIIDDAIRTFRDMEELQRKADALAIAEAEAEEKRRAILRAREQEALERGLPSPELLEEQAAEAEAAAEQAAADTPE